MRAVDKAHVEVVRFLTTHGADPIIADNNGASALMRPVRKRYGEISRLLVEHGVDLVTMRTSEQIASALLRAVDNRDVEVTRCLARRGADLNIADSDGMTVLMRSADKGHIEMVRCLAENGADLNTTSNSGLTALMRAVGNGEDDVIRCLTECGADPNASNNAEWTALMQAAAYGNVKVLRYLIDLGADPSATDNVGETALMLAAKNNNVDATKYLASRGANVNAMNQKGETAFRLAVNRGYQDIQRVLWPALEPSWAANRATNAVTASALDRSLERGFIAPLELELLECIDNGNVIGDYRAKWLDADVIVKLFVPDGSNSTFADEVQLWQQLRHPNVIKLHGVCHGAGLQLFVSEYASGGSLSEYLRPRTARSSSVSWMCLHQAALGLEYLHERKIVHGDLRCSNILIGSDHLVKLANFV